MLYLVFMVGLFMKTIKNLLNNSIILNHNINNQILRNWMPYKYIIKL